MRKLTDDSRGDSGQANALEHGVDSGPRLRAAMHACCREPEIFAHRQAVKDAWHLRLDANTAPRDLVGLGACHVLATEENRAGCWLELAGQHLEEGAFAGAVWADQTTQLALGQGEVDVT